MSILEITDLSKHYGEGRNRTQVLSDINLKVEDGCARHGHWIGGESPLRGELVATVSRRQLHVD